MEKKNEIFNSTKKEIMSKDNLLKMSPNIHILFDNDILHIHQKMEI